MKPKKEFKRKEHKFFISHDIYDSFINDLSNNMSIDSHGLHTIMSLYYDTDDFSFIKHSMEKPTYKEKLRVRSYGIPNNQTPVFLELKKKIQGTVYKRRIELPYVSYLDWERLGKISSSLNNTQIYREIEWVCKRHKSLRPKVLISYDRLSFYCRKQPDFRVTFDQDIRFRTTDLRLESGSYGKLVAPEIGVLMEVKVLGAYPLWFVNLLNKYDLRRMSFSKYAQTFQRYIINKPNNEVMKHVG